MPRPRLLWHNILFLSFTPLLALILIPLYLIENGSHWGLWLLLALTFIVSNMSITCGYHRYFSHRSYHANSFIEWLYIMLGSGAFQGSVLQWASDHRRHHRCIDTEHDPYNINAGFWYAHIGWMFRASESQESRHYAKDLEKNFWIRLQHRYYVFFAAFMGFILPGLIAWAFGIGFWGGVLFGGLLRIILSQHSTFLINSYAHTFGKQTYTDKHTARDSLILALLTFGEGYHNFHHSFQADYRNGTRWYHWDPTKWSIRFLSWLGLASHLKRAKKEEILRAKLAMEEKFMLAKGAPIERVHQLKSRIEDAQKRVRHLRDSYQLAKRDLVARSRSWSDHMRAEIRMAEIEFRSAYGQWRTLRRAFKRMAVAV